MTPQPSSSTRFFIAVACCLGGALPLLMTPFPPTTDVPQHVAQVRLFFETMQGASQPNGVNYIVQWLTPYSLVYLVMAGLWKILPPERVGQATLVALCFGWALAIHWLAWRRRRSVAAAALASTLYYCHVTYWGFLSFSIGLPVFLVWLDVTSSGFLKFQNFSIGDEKPETRNPKPETFFRLALIAFLLFLLYEAHALWFAVGLLWLGVETVAFRPPLRRTLARAAVTTPLAVVALFCYRRLATDTQFVEHKLIFKDAPVLRLGTRWFVESVFGGVHGWLEASMLAVLLGWLAWSVASRRKAFFRESDAGLLVAGVMLLGLGLVLPYQFQYTIELAERWIPAAFIILLLAVPAPVLKSGERPLFVGTLAVVFVFWGWTAFIWRDFDRKTMTGFRESLAALPEYPRLVGLDFIGELPEFRRRPVLQTAAYGEVVRGGTYSLSFAKFPQSFVKYAPGTTLPWTDGLEWDPYCLTEADLEYFDYALVGGDPLKQLQFQDRFPTAVPVTTGGRWRLYRLGK